MEGFGAVLSRQRVEILFGVPKDAQGNQILLGASGGGSDTYAQPQQPTGRELGREIAGYPVICFYGLSDQAFSVQIYEAVSCDGPYVLAQTLTSAVVGGLNRISQRVSSNALYMRVVFLNTGGSPQTQFDFAGFGLPAGS